MVVDVFVLSRGSDQRRFVFCRIVLENCEPNLGSHMVRSRENTRGAGPRSP